MTQTIQGRGDWGVFARRAESESRGYQASHRHLEWVKARYLHYHTLHWVNELSLLGCHSVAVDETVAAAGGSSRSLNMSTSVNPPSDPMNPGGILLVW